MITSWLIINSSPPIAFYANEIIRDQLPDIAHRRLISTPPIYNEVSVDGGKENSNATVTIDNGDGGITEWFDDPPLLESAEVWHSINGDIKQTFVGTIQNVRIDADISVTIEA